MEDTPIKREKLYSLITRVLFEDGNLTAHEIASILKAEGHLVYGARQEVAPRLTELEKKGRVEVVGKVFDLSTGKNVHLYGLSHE
jgi:hypothetical protein